MIHDRTPMFIQIEIGRVGDETQDPWVLQRELSLLVLRAAICANALDCDLSVTNFESLVPLCFSHTNVAGQRFPVRSLFFDELCS